MITDRFNKTICHLLGIESLPTANVHFACDCISCSRHEDSLCPSKSKKFPLLKVHEPTENRIEFKDVANMI